jgi:hypothetical protein
MSIKDIEAAVLKLIPKDRARLAGKLLESLEDLSEEESEIIWAQERSVETRLGIPQRIVTGQQRACYAGRAQNSGNKWREFHFTNSPSVS